MKMMRNFEERAEELGHQSLVKDAEKCAEEVSYSVEVKRSRADFFISRERGCHTREDAESGVEGRS